MGLTSVLIWVTLVCVCSGLEEGMQIDSASSCSKLQNPEHGKYQCVQPAEGEICTLVCNEGYTVPITEYNQDGKHIPLDQRGVYKCKTTPGGLIWTPSLFFDCIEKLHPANFMYYFSLTLPPPCANDSEKTEHLSHMFPNGPEGKAKLECAVRFILECQWTYDIKCINGKWLMDTWFRVPFSMKLFNSYHEWDTVLISEMKKDIKTNFVILRQEGEAIINSEGNYLECPRATRLEKDFTCRGCSKGHYMSQRELECLPCPKKRYQDENFAHSCKPCPAGSSKEETGLTKLIDCFHYSYWEEDTSMATILGALTLIVILSAILLWFRSRIRNEPDGLHREVYYEPEFNPVGGGPLLRFAREQLLVEEGPSQFDSMRISTQYADFQTHFSTAESKKSEGTDYTSTRRSIVATLASTRRSIAVVKHASEESVSEYSDSDEGSSEET